nr:RNA-directed DNA polymerase, eukaryota, reverse transcriptase zinc-binding domain protein [Tanacetum cinerariifolium]
MWLWIEFDTNEACLKLQSNKEMSWYFTLLKHLHHSFILDERVAWIKIGGLPLNAWTPKAFKKIADSWVNDNCKVVVLGKTYNAYVKEFAGWAPDIKATDTTSRSNLEMDISDKHEDNLNDNGLLEKEEREIPNSNVNEEEEYVKNTQWTDGDANSRKNQDNFLTDHLYSPKVNTKAQNEDLNSISKPPGVNKCKAIAKLYNKHKVSFLGIQETHSTNLDPFKVKCTWNFSGHVLDCHISDHRPILLSYVSADFGSIPFKFCNSWLLDKNLHSTISDFWGNYALTYYANPILSFKNKIKALKIVIKEWSLNRKDSRTREKEDLNKKIKDFDAAIATRYADLSVDAQRSFWIDSLRTIELKENMVFSEKAKIKWGIEADENSKFFHAIFNQKR